MKRIYLFFYLILVTIIVNAQYNTVEKFYDAGDIVLPSLLLCDDLNGDTLKDVLTVNYWNNNFILLANNRSFQLDETYDVVLDSIENSQLYSPYFWNIEDINNDGSKDLYYLSDETLWLKNDGNGNFNEVFNLQIEEDIVSHQALDFNADNAIDFIFLSIDRILYYLQNNGDGSFLPVQALNTNTSFLSNIRSFILEDFNNDNNFDLAISNYDSLQIHYGNGTSIFEVQTKMETEYAISRMQAVDFDKDNDSDLVVDSYNKMNLITNNNGNWTELLLLDDYFPDSYYTSIADLDNNDVYDIVRQVATYDADYNEFVHLIWYKNFENGAFSDTTLIFGNSELTSFLIDDLNNDGLEDLIFLKNSDYFSGTINGNIGWIDNESLNDEIPDSENDNLQFDDSGFYFLNRNISFQNIDDDSQSEVLISKINNAEPQILTLINGQPLNEYFSDTTLLHSNIAYDFNNPDLFPQILIGDLNNDGVKDIIQKTASLQYGVFIPTEPGDFGEPILIDVDPSQIEDFSFFGLYDMDDDGDLDIYSSFKFLDGWRLIWLLNNGEGLFSDFEVIENLPYTYEKGYNNIFLSDIDGDAYKDIIAYSDEAIVWYKNNGNGNFSTAKLVSINYNFDQIGIDLVDINTDGSSELLVFTGNVVCLSHFCFYLTDFFIFDFNLGTQKFEEISYLSSWPLETYGGIVESGSATARGSDINFDVVYRDFDDDSNIDIISINPEEGNIYVLKGDGLGNFPEQEILIVSDIFKTNTDFFGTIDRVGLYETDIEGDGDLDLIFLKSSDYQGGLYLIENKEIDLGVDGDEDGIAFLYDCNDSDSTILDTLITPVIAVTDNFCEGNELIFNIENVANNVTYQWMTPNGNFDIANFEIEELSSSDEGLYQVQSFSNHCESPISEILIEVYDNPNVEVSFMNDSIIAISEEQNLSYQWFLNGNEIEGANDNYYVPTETGEYQVSVVNENGCEDISDVYQHIINGLLSNQMETFKIYPNPVSNNTFLNISIPNKWQSEEIVYVILNANGQEMFKGVLSHSNQIPIQKLSAGYYSLNLITQTNLGQASFFVVD